MLNEAYDACWSQPSTKRLAKVALAAITGSVGFLFVIAGIGTQFKADTNLEKRGIMHMRNGAEQRSSSEQSNSALGAQHGSNYATQPDHAPYPNRFDTMFPRNMDVNTL